MSEALNDLQSSLKMFTQGVQQYSISSGIQDAQAKVAQINQDASLDIMQKRQQQMQAAQALALHMTSAGADESHIQGAVGAIAPPAITDSKSAYQQALANGGDPKLLDVATKMQKFEEDPANQKLEYQGKNQLAQVKEKGNQDRLTNAALEPGKLNALSAKQQAEQAKLVETDFQNLGKEYVNPSSRKLFGQWQGVVDQADATTSLLKIASKLPAGTDLDKLTPEQRTAAFNNLDKRDVYKVSTGLQRMITRGAPTDAGTEHMIPSTVQADLNGLLEKAQNSPNKAEQGKFMEKFYQTLQTERNTFQDKKLQAIGSLGDIYKRAHDADPSRFGRVLDGLKPPPAAKVVDATTQRKIDIARKFPNDPDAAAYLKSLGLDK